MTSPILPLRAAILARCAGDGALATLLGGPGRLYDEPPRGEPPVYAVFGACEVRDWSTSGDRGHEQELSIDVWALSGSAASAIAAAARIAELLDDAALTLSGHRLVSFAVTSQDVTRDAETGLARATIRLRAATEVAA